MTVRMKKGPSGIHHLQTLPLILANRALLQQSKQRPMSFQASPGSLSNSTNAICLPSLHRMSHFRSSTRPPQRFCHILLASVRAFAQPLIYLYGTSRDVCQNSKTKICKFCQSILHHPASALLPPDRLRFEGQEDKEFLTEEFDYTKSLFKQSHLSRLHPPEKPNTAKSQLLVM